MNGEPYFIIMASTVDDHSPDTVFQTVQDLSYNDALIKSAEATIKSCEEELAVLKGIKGIEPVRWWQWKSGVTSARISQLIEKMRAAERNVEGAEKRNKELKSGLVV